MKPAIQGMATETFNVVNMQDITITTEKGNPIVYLDLWKRNSEDDPDIIVSIDTDTGKIKLITR